VIFDAVGKSSGMVRKKMLKKSGVFLTVASNPGMITAEDLNDLKFLSEHNRIKPVIDKIIPLSKIKEGHFYVEKGRKRGNVAMELSHPGDGPELQSDP
jgi:NADPH:quinone reductase-like Zn-dependent oxidoreductase